jgi:hypothetical protein
VRSLRPQSRAHNGTQTTISTTATNRAGPAISLTSPYSRRRAPRAAGTPRTSTTDVSDTRRAYVPTTLRVGPSHRVVRSRFRTSHRRAHRLSDSRSIGSAFSGEERRIASLGGERSLVTASDRTPPPPPERNQRLAAVSSGRPQRCPVRIFDEHRRTCTGSFVDGRHRRPPPSKRSAGRVPVDANPQCGEPLGGGQSVGGVRNRLGRLVSDRPPITVHLFLARDRTNGALFRRTRAQLVARARSATQPGARDAFNTFA